MPDDLFRETPGSGKPGAILKPNSDMIATSDSAPSAPLQEFSPSTRLSGVDFDWSDGSTVIYEQPRTAVYYNPHGQVVIRQEGGPCDDDVWLYFNTESLPLLIEALQEALRA